MKLVKTLNKLNAGSISMAPPKYYKFIAIITITQQSLFVNDEKVLDRNNGDVQKSPENG